MATIKASAPMVWLACNRCGERFGQPDGAVTSQICKSCLSSMAAAFRAIPDDDAAQITKAASELLAAVYGFLVQGERESQV